jgi:uncharacterized protein (DUF58 family)
MRATYVKRFQEEREITFVIMVDLSASGQYSTEKRSKIELAAELAGTLAFSAAKSNDRVALLAFTDRVEKYTPPGKGPDHVMQILRTILFHKPASPKTNIDNALRYLNRVQPRPTMVFLISDFQATGYARSLTMTNQRHSMAAFIIQDPSEFELPNVGRATLHDPESGEQVELNTSRPAVRRAFAKAAAERREALVRLLRHAGVKHMTVDTSGTYVTRLAQFLSTELTRKIA